MGCCGKHKGTGVGTYERNTLNGRHTCLICVEKHIGSAIVLMSEAANGYPEHRVLAVGHLDQAVEESGQWPHLRAFLRAYRHDYQETGIVPNWHNLAQTMDRIRRHGTDVDLPEYSI